MTVWRLLDTGRRSAAQNMALDDVLLCCRARGNTPNTLRFLQFKPPAVLVGYHQSVENEARIEFCEEEGIDVNRRLTGGGAIFFDETSIGWEVIASKRDLNTYPSLFNQPGIFREMCRAPILALRRMGVKAGFRPKNDIEVDGRKISGTGGTERGDAFLFQGTLLVDFDVETMLHALKIPVMKLKDKEVESFRERVTCLNRELGYTPPIKAVKRGLAEGFEEALGVSLIEEGLTQGEKRLLDQRTGFYTSPDWLFLDRQPEKGAAVVQSISKTPGGLVKVSLILDGTADIIRSALITGDFFVFPSRGILDLEARLKDAPCEEDEIQSIIHGFFKEKNAWIPGVTPGELSELVLEAVRKKGYKAYGIRIDEANHLYTVNRSAANLFEDGYQALLLPYCAKLATCEYRRREGCLKCGGCSIGDAYELAEKAGLKPITIQSFEHLMKTLDRLQRDGVKGYIGCCCEGFYCKHQDDLEAAGLPGVLVDIDDQTCYDLGKEKEAVDGTFESQTELKISLLSKLLRYSSMRGENDR